MRRKPHPTRFNQHQEKFNKELRVPKLTDDLLKTLGFYTKDGQFNNVVGLFSDKNTFSGINIVRFSRSISEILER